MCDSGECVVHLEQLMFVGVIGLEVAKENLNNTQYDSNPDRRASKECGLFHFVGLHNKLAEGVQTGHCSAQKQCLRVDTGDRFLESAAKTKTNCCR